MIDQYASPEELRRLVSTLLVTVGAVVVFALFAFIVVPGLRNANKPPAAAPVAAPQGESGWLDPAEFPPAKGYELPPVDPATVLTANPPLLARGQKLYEQNCAACHGPAGKGDGPAGATLSPRPRDFTQPDGWKNGFHLTEIFKTLKEGLKGSSMASYDYLSAKDRMALDHYVQSLGKFPHGTDDPAAIASLMQQFSSAGEKVPNRIPVSLAMRKLASEYAARPASAGPALPAEVASLLGRLIADGDRVSRTLTLTPAWRESPAALARIAVRGAPQNGFAVACATLTPEQWRVLHEALGRSIAP